MAWPSPATNLSVELVKDASPRRRKKEMNANYAEAEVFAPMRASATARHGQQKSLVMTEFHPLRSAKDGGSEPWKRLNAKAEERAKKLCPSSMPSLNHATMKDFEEVYEPSDDTYLLIDGIQSDIEENSSLMKSSRHILGLYKVERIVLFLPQKLANRCTPFSLRRDGIWQWCSNNILFKVTSSCSSSRDRY